MEQKDKIEKAHVIMKKSYIYLENIKEKRTGKDEERQLDGQIKPCLDLNDCRAIYLK